MSKENPSSARSTRRSAQAGLPMQSMRTRTIRFTLDNEEVHEVSLTWENEGHDKDKARTWVPESLRSVAHSPSDSSP